VRDLAAVRAGAVSVALEAGPWPRVARLTASGIRLAGRVAVRPEQREVPADQLAEREAPLAQQAAREIQRTPMARGIRLEVAGGLAAAARRAE